MKENHRHYFRLEPPKYSTSMTCLFVERTIHPAHTCHCSLSPNNSFFSFSHPSWQTVVLFFFCQRSILKSACGIICISLIISHKTFVFSWPNIVWRSLTSWRFLRVPDQVLRDPLFSVSCVVWTAHRSASLNSAWGLGAGYANMLLYLDNFIIICTRGCFSLSV